MFDEPLVDSATGGLNRAVFVVSIDTEMAWGLNHKPHTPYSYPSERADLARLVELFDRWNVPATFAIVGHLMLSDCEAVDGRKHPEVLRPDYDWLPGDWFDLDPCSNSTVDPDWYAPDLLPLVAGAEADHELASHGFSHMMAGEVGCSREAYDSELRAAVAAAEAHGITLRSFIFPRNSYGHVDLLADHGFVAYRGPRSVPPVGGLGKVRDKLFGSERTTVRPIREDGIWNLPASMLLTVESRPRTWRLWLRQVERRLSQTVEQRAMFHLWFHPHDLRDRTDDTFEALERLCRRVDAYRRDDRIEAVTMGGLANALSSSLGHPQAA